MTLQQSSWGWGESNSPQTRAHCQEGGALLMQFKSCVASAIMSQCLISEGIKQTSKNHGPWWSMKGSQREGKQIPTLLPQASSCHCSYLMVMLSSDHPRVPTWSPTCTCPTWSPVFTITLCSEQYTQASPMSSSMVIHPGVFHTATWSHSHFSTILLHPEKARKQHKTFPSDTNSTH